MKVGASLLALGSTGMVLAGTSVSWVSPADGTCFPVGTSVTPTGVAGASGVVGGTGLDLALVLDSSGSMGSVNDGKTRNQWVKDASIKLVNALPEATTSVAVIEFDSDANTLRVLTPLISGKANIIAAINLLDASGNTNIGSGIDRAKLELTGGNHTAGRSQQMVVLSDGQPTSGNAELSALNAMAAGVDAIHTVGIPGHSVATMRDIADGPDDVVGTADDYGVYTGVNDLTTLEGIFNGTTGNLVGLSKVEVTKPDGTTVVVPTDGLGNFSAPAAWAIQAGNQTWTAKAYGTDGTTATADLTLCGRSIGTPDAASTALLLGLGALGLLGYTRKQD